MSLTVTRWTDFIAFLICGAFLVVGAYLQYKLGLIPCPLCIIQRFLITCLGILFLMGALFNFSSMTRSFLHTVTFLLSTLGAAVASRQLWLEHLPTNKLISCKANLAEYSHSAFFQHAIDLFFKGTRDCGESQWSFLGLSMPMWTLLLFLFLIALTLRQVYLNRINHKRSSLF